MIVNAVIADVGKYAEAKRISTSSAFLKSELGASTYEMIYPFDDKKIAVIRNENAAVEGQPFNRALYESDGETVKNIIQGKFIVVSTDENKIRSLSEEDTKKYLEMFHFPEKFYFDDGVIAFKYEPKEMVDSKQSRIIGDIWDGKYSPQKIKPGEEYDKRRKRVNKAVQELLCVLPSSMESVLDELLEASSMLFSFEKKIAFQNGVDFGKRMFNETQ